MLPPATLAQAARLLDALRARGWCLATAESCTGGLVAAALTHVAGSSDVLERGLVTYSNAAKVELLGVAPDLIEKHGAVSEPVARTMAEGALARTPSVDIAISVTGIAGPGGSSAAKPVGLVWFGCAVRDGATATRSTVFPGDRAAVRAGAVAHALAFVAERASSQG